MSQPAEPPVPPPLGGLAAQVSIQRLQSLLINRSTDVLTDPETRPLLTETLRGMSAQVTAVIGPTPSPAVLDLAIEAVTLGAAASLEEALFPEQQLGDNARAEQLQRRYLGVLADLRRAASASGGRGGTFSGVVHVGRGGGSW